MKLFRTLILFVLCLCCASVAFAQSASDLTYMTEDYPPFNFEEGGQAQGITVDLLEKMFQQMGVAKSRADVQVLPWAKSYEAVQTTPNTVLFSMTRTEQREAQFKWVGPIMPSRIVLLAPKAAGIKISSFDDLKKYKIGAIREDIGEQLLISGGIDKNTIDSSATIDANIKKLDRGRIDLWTYSETVGMYSIKKAGFNPQDYETVYVLKEGASYYAFHKETNDALIQSFQTALDAVKDSGELQRILNNYGM